MTDQSRARDEEKAPGAVAVLVPAGGAGTRLGGRRKQFRTLGGQPVLVQTLFAFDKHDGVDHLVVAAPSDELTATTDMLRAAGLSKLTAVVEGGASRQKSVRNALRAVPSPVTITLVHDAVRPFVGSAAITRVIEASRSHGAAALALPVADTLRRGADDVFGETVDRAGLFRMQTPQGFRRSWLEDAHRQAAADDVQATDDVALVQRIGHEVRIVEGHRRNFKITTTGDWQMAQQLWAAWSAAPDRSTAGS